jgi:TonB family protein
MKRLLLAFALLAPSLVALQLPTGTITGQVLLREGPPASGVRVAAMAVPDPGVQGSTTSLVGLAMSDSSGRYRLENIPPGRYYVVAGLVDLPTYYPGVTSATGATALNVLSGTPISGIDFTMVIPTGVTVSGRVVRPTGEPVPGVQSVRLMGGPNPAVESAVRQDGSFVFSRVRPGSYQLRVYPTSLVTQATAVVVTDRDVTGIEVQVLPTVEVSGSLNVAGNGLRPRLVLMFSPLKGVGSVPSLGMQANGAFRVAMPEGEYRIAWTELPLGYYVESITSGSVDLLASTLKVAAGSPVPPVTVNLGVDAKPPWVKVSGRVNSLPVARAGTTFRLSLTSTTVLDPLEVSINPNGSFEFPRLLPGTYTARLNPILPVSATSFTVPNRDVTDLTISVPPIKQVRGVITGQGTVRPRTATLTWGQSPFTMSVSAPVEADGSFNVFVLEGERQITASVSGFSIQTFTYGSINLLSDPVKVSMSDTSEFQLGVTPITPTGVVGGGGVVGGVVSGDPVLVSSVPPAYPPLARAAQVQGNVVVQVQVLADGTVGNAVVVSGHALLNEAAIQAVQQWRFRPGALPTVANVTVNFSLR